MKVLSVIVILAGILGMFGCTMGPGPDQVTREQNEEREQRQRSEDLTRSLAR